MNEQKTLPAPDSPRTCNNAPSPSDRTRATNDRRAPGSMPGKIHGHGPCTAPCHKNSLHFLSLDPLPPKPAHP